MSDYAISQLIGRIDVLEKQVSKLRRIESRGWEINYVVPAGGVATYPIATIPQYARHARFLIQARSSAAGVASTALNLRINGDAGANYYYAQLQVIGAVVGAAELLAQTSWQVAEIPGATATAKFAGVLDLVIYWYGVLNTDVWKVCFTCINYHPRSTAANGRRLDVWGGDYQGNAPVTSLTFSTGVANLDAGSVFTMYGTG